MNPIRSSLLLAGLAGVLGVPMVADAATYIVGGGICSPSMHQDLDIFEHSYGRIMNSWGNTVSYKGVDCPITRHNATSGLSGTAYARIYNDESQNTGALSCSLMSFQSNSLTVDSESTNTTSSGYQSLSFAASNISNYTYGRHVVLCNLGVGDILTSIRYSEP